MKVKNFHQLFVEQLIDLHSAEKQLTKALPLLSEAATDEELVSALEDHLSETEKQLERLEKIFEDMGESIPVLKKCKGMEGIVKEGEDVVKMDAPDAVKDAAIITAAQRAEHYEIAGYGTVCEMAKLMGHDKELKVLKGILDEEEKTDKLLTKIAQKVNKEASQM